jgi:DNA-binding IclR family transcriptional regulator
MQHGTKSLAGALDLLKLFAAERHEWRVTDLATVAGLHKSQVSRILRTFEDYGFVQRNAGQYQLGRAFTGYASLVESDRDLIELARPFMEKLGRQTQSTVALKRREGGETVTIDRVESRHFHRVDYPVGFRLALNASSSGKVFLAYMTPEERHRLSQAGFFRRFTDKTKTNLASLEKDLSLALQRGFALSDEEHLDRTRGLAAPIFGPGNRLLAALSLGLPKILLPDKKIFETGRAVRKAAMDISRLLGYKTRGNGTKGKRSTSGGAGYERSRRA